MQAIELELEWSRVVAARVVAVVASGCPLRIGARLVATVVAVAVVAVVVVLCSSSNRIRIGYIDTG